MGSAIVYFIDHLSKIAIKHSAWDTYEEAKKQLRTLQDHGYKTAYIEDIDHNYNNGHYFV